MIVKLDLDGVLRNFTLGLHRCLRAHLPSTIPEEPPLITEWGMEKFYPFFDSQEFRELVFRSDLTYGLFVSCPAYEGAAEFSQKLKKNSIVWIVTHQPSIKSAVATLHWLDRNWISFDEIVLSYRLPKCLLPGILVDDRPANLKKGDILVTQPWNVKYKWDGYRANQGSPPNVVDYDDLWSVIDERISYGLR